jgi:deoxycytidylate deaminase
MHTTFGRFVTKNTMSQGIEKNNIYPYLPDGRSILYVPESNPFMIEAKIMRDGHSTDLNHSTGAVVVLGGKIIGRAANKSAINNPKLLELHKKGLCTRKILKIKSGEKYWLCPGCASSKYHAEWGAVRDAIKSKGNIVGADLYLYGHWWCCKPCWDSMIDAGIKDVYLVEGATRMFKK